MANGAIVWLTGHSKSGKTTLSKLLFHELQRQHAKLFRLDSDTLPKAIIKPEAAGWEEKQRLKNENLIFLSKLLCDNGYLVLIASVGRYAQWRNLMRDQAAHYLEIYLACPLEVRMQRDDAGKYETHSEYFHFYEEPATPDLNLDTSLMTPEDCVQVILRLLKERNILQL